jgi:transcriptional regulator with XRE-family HTH domain
MHIFGWVGEPYRYWVEPDPKQFVSDVTDALKARREALGLPHETVAKRAGLHRSTVSRVEAKKISGTLFVFQAIANAVNIRLSEVCGDAEEKGDG